jgi:hypothetical protein
MYKQFSLDHNGKPNYPLIVWLLVLSMDLKTFSEFKFSTEYRQAQIILPFLKSFDAIEKVSDYLNDPEQLDILERWLKLLLEAILLRQMSLFYPLVEESYDSAALVHISPNKIRLR